MVFRDDCLHYIGSRPCVHNRLCEGCPHYEKAGPPVLIIKTAASGDVLRSTTLLPGLREAVPGARVVWLTAPAAAPLLEGNPLIHEIVPFDAAAWPALAPRRFSLVLSLDKEPGPCGIAMLARADEKRGIGLAESGRPVPLNDVAHDYFSLGLSDELKFKINTKTYHELIAEAVELPYKGWPPELHLAAREIDYGADMLKLAGWDGASPVIGINTGAGTAFANKMLSTVAVLDVIDGIAAAAPGVFIALLGGPLEREKNRHIAMAARGRAGDTGCSHPVRGFAGIVSHCSVLLCGDTLALHIGAALGVKTVALFGPTCAVEIDLFSLGVKIASKMDCVPCYRKECEKSPNCMDSLDTAEIAAAVAGFSS